MKIVVDTNVFLDVILAREPMCHASAKVLELSHHADIELLMPAHSAGTILYIVEKNRDRDTAVKTLGLCMGLCRVAALDESTILRGLALEFKDPEDSFVAAIALRERAELIATNNVKDFSNSPVPAITPSEIIARLSSAEPDATSSRSGHIDDEPYHAYGSTATR